MSLRYKACLCIPALVYLFVAVYWHYRGVDGLTGDEKHYLYITESMVEDRDVDVRNNLARAGIDRPEYKHSQSFVRPHGWFSVHNLGLPALVALPWALCGNWGARLMLTVCCAFAAPTLYATINSVWKCPRNSLLVTMGLALSMPLLYACHQLYPDLPAGLLLLFAAATALAAANGSTAPRWRDVLFALALAFLPWLHVKFSAPALVAFAWYVDATRRRRCALVGAALAGSLALLVSYNVYAFGKPTGPYSHDALGLHWNSLIVFLGLHVDQAQGIFLQQPLWILGVFGLAPMCRDNRRSFFWWLVLTASVTVPNAMHPCWYGGGSYIGRFGSTSALLWAIPLAHGARAMFAESSFRPAVAAGLSVLLQAFLASHWLHAGSLRVGYNGPEGVWVCNSVYPAALKVFLPYCVPNVRFWSYPPNSAALILIGGALWAGFFWQRRRLLARRCLAAAMLVAVALPVVVGTKPAALVWTGDSMPGWVGRADGTCRVAAEGWAQKGALVHTPHLFPPKGNYRIAVDYQAEGDKEHVGMVLYGCGQRLQLLSTLTPANGRPMRCVSTVEVLGSEFGKPFSVFVWYEGQGKLSVARLSVEKL